MITDRRLLILSILFAVLIVGARLYILTKYSVGVEYDYVLALTLGLVNEFVLGLILSFGIFNLKNNSGFYLFLIFVVFIIIIKLACFHYESVFNRLPGNDLFYYFSELSYLSSSLDSNIPALNFLTEIIIVAGVFCACAAYLRGVNLRSVRQSNAIEYFALIVVFISIGLQAIPTLIPDRFFWGSREAFVWMLQSQFIKEKYELDKMQLVEKDFQRFLKYHGQDHTAPVPNPKYPLCTYTHKDAGTKSKRNVILLILEGVGKYEIGRVIDGRLMMPNLKKIASENISFSNIIAPGTRSAQALTAMFSGLPAQPNNNYLWVKPMLNFNGFPKILVGEGYRTAYFHGSDLSFENQRIYLGEIGFNEIYEYAPDHDHQVYGWGYDDGVMFGELRNWIENHHASYSGEPYLASLFTLSTHDPYVLPSDWQPRFSSETRVMLNAGDWSRIEGDSNIISSLAETYAFLDYHLGQFYDWFKINEKNTILVITGDHAPHLFNDGNEVESKIIQFFVPLIMAGLSESEKRDFQSYQDRFGSLHDIPATLMEILGQVDLECDLGVNLFATEEDWPGDRTLYAMGGNNLEGMFFLNRGVEVLYDRIRKEFRAVNRKKGVQAELSKIEDVSDDLQEYYSTINSVHYYLLNKDAYFRPTVEDKIDTRVLSRVEIPIFVSHRGHLQGPGGNQKTDNSKNLLDAVIASDLEWVEIDVQITRDGVPILMHDATVEIDGNARYIDTLTLEELYSVDRYADILTLEEAVARYTPYLNLLVEIKPPREISKTMHISREVARIIRDKPSGKKIIVDSFNGVIVDSVKRHCQCEVGIDTPFGEKISLADLQQFKKSNVDWIYVHYSVIDQELIRNVHDNGLKIMAYTVNSPETVESWIANQLPDGIITDDINIMYKFSTTRFSSGGGI